ncbi:MAG: metal-dependent hydrolase [Rubricoccaceae bacterium]
MLIGHLPAGYLAATATLRRIPPARRRGLMMAALIGSVLPDLDLIYFYGVDSSVHHHAFPPHWPLLWVVVMIASSLLVARSDQRRWGHIGLAVSAAALLHCVLDSIAGSVPWLAPFSDHETTLVTVPATHDSWIVSFITHWTFGVELALGAVALVVWSIRRRRTAR